MATLSERLAKLRADHKAQTELIEELKGRIARVKQDVELYDSGSFDGIVRRVGSWEGWPLVSVIGLPLGPDGEEYALAVCRSARWGKDILLSMRGVPGSDFVALTRLATEEIGKMSGTEMATVPLQSGAIFDSKGDPVSPVIFTFTKTLPWDLPPQH